MPEPPPKEISQALQTASVPLVYVNGFVNNLGTSDISLFLLNDAVPIMKLSMSYTTAKTLSGLLAEAISILENATGNKIMTAHDVEAGLRKRASEKK